MVKLNRKSRDCCVGIYSEGHSLFNFVRVDSQYPLLVHARVVNVRWFVVSPRGDLTDLPISLMRVIVRVGTKVSGARECCSHATPPMQYTETTVRTGVKLLDAGPLLDLGEGVARYPPTTSPVRVPSHISPKCYDAILTIVRSLFRTLHPPPVRILAPRPPRV
jgi:hypothetical protein